MPSARPLTVDAGKAPPSPKASAKPPTGKPKKASPKSPANKAAAEAKVASLREQVGALQTELELARMQLQEQHVNAEDMQAPQVDGRGLLVTLQRSFSRLRSRYECFLRDL
jgi:type II secretory pathway component HofQ